MKIWASLIVVAMAVAIFSGAAQASFTVATFADPSGNANNPLFTVNWVNATVDGGWADGKNNLLLEIPFTSASFANAWFAMDQLTITNTISFGGYTYGQTGAGEIRFYAAGSTVDPLLKITFENSFVSRQALGADDFIIDHVTITGSAIPVVLSYEQFNFSFANVTTLANQNGFTSTASFTSSAIPEPTTIAILAFGVLPAVMKRKRCA